MKRSREFCKGQVLDRNLVLKPVLTLDGDLPSSRAYSLLLDIFFPVSKLYRNHPFFTQ
ncbi:hypothetical protein I79_010787 [Cricetulus griseus]|uniref:Uncharacterized protein n=1 Tax=Cricetulus griseus TaxID=10029 RepID=G3HJE4_CRIGR|nr:hypothetical protein I79_010787 [Cricetulus griseus]